MANINSSIQFKSYQQQQILLLPPSLDKLIDEHHLVRVVNRVVDAMDITGLINQYKGGGTTAYHPRMLLKVMLYAYSVKVYPGLLRFPIKLNAGQEALKGNLRSSKRK